MKADKIYSFKVCDEHSPLHFEDIIYIQTDEGGTGVGLTGILGEKSNTHMV